MNNKKYHEKILCSCGYYFIQRSKKQHEKPLYHKEIIKQILTTINQNKKQKNKNQKKYQKQKKILEDKKVKYYMIYIIKFQTIKYQVQM